MANRICYLPLRVPQAQCLFIKSRIVPWYMSSWFRSLWAAQVKHFSHELYISFFPWVSTLLSQSNHFSQQLFLAAISFQILLNRQNSRHFCGLCRSRIFKSLSLFSQLCCEVKTSQHSLLCIGQICGNFSVSHL